MKPVSMFALSCALALGGAAIVGTPVLAAKEDKAAKPAPVIVGAKVRDAVNAGRKALAAGDTATATAQYATAKGVATTADENYVVASFGYDVASKAQNSALVDETIDGMIASGKADAAQLPALYLIQGQIAFQAKNYVKAETALDRAIGLGVVDENAGALLVEAKNGAGKPVEAVETLETVIAKKKAAGQAVPSEWYERGLNMALATKSKDPAAQARLNAAAGRLAQIWVAAYPTKSHWRDALLIHRQVGRIDAEQEIDMWRLMRAAGALTGESDYMEYVRLIYLKFPAEAAAVLEEGRTNGFVDLNAANRKDIYTLVKGKIAADKASLTKTPATGKSALSNGDAYFGYGEWATAADLYRVAIAKGDADTNVANFRLGMALARAGQKDAARQAFAQVTGSRAELARYWTSYLNQPAG